MNHPAGTWVLMLASILVALVIAVALRKVVLAPAWPFCVRCEDRRRGMVLGVVGSVVAMVLGIVLASVTGELWFLALTGLGIVPALLFGSFAGWAAVAGAHVAQDRASVVVPRPAPRYVAALPPHPSAAHRVRQ